MDYLFLEKKCRECGTTPTALSLKLGLSKGNTSNWKKGGNPSAEILVKLADELDCTVDNLLGRSNNVTLNFGNNNTAGRDVNVTNGKNCVENCFDKTTLQVAQIFQNLNFEDKLTIMNLISDLSKKRDSTG